MSGKGSRQRKTDAQAYGANYDAIFNSQKLEREKLDADDLQAIINAGVVKKCCGSCKHYNPSYNICNNENIVNMIDTDGGHWGLKPPADFYCSLWEEKV